MATEQKPDIERLVWPKDARTFQWLDRAKTIMDIATRAGTMYLGYQAFEQQVPGSGLAGAIVSQIAMKLATADNMASGAAGVATLAGIGLLNVQPEGIVPVADQQSWIQGLWRMLVAMHPVTWGEALRP